MSAGVPAKAGTPVLGDVATACERRLAALDCLRRSGDTPATAVVAPLLLPRAITQIVDIPGLPVKVFVQGRSNAKI